MNYGSKNLIILGLVSVTIAIITSGISLAVYHNSGDIYLDRSRPGFLPDQQEIKESNGTEYTFSDNGGEISESEIKEYLENFNEVQEKFKALPDPYSAESLSDEALNISTN